MSDVPRDSAFCRDSDEFDLEQLGERVHISRKTLYRKLVDPHTVTAPDIGVAMYLVRILVTTSSA